MTCLILLCSDPFSSVSPLNIQCEGQVIGCACNEEWTERDSKRSLGLGSVPG